MDSLRVQCLLVVLILITLFISEAWILGNARESTDVVLNSILVIIFAVFIAEILIASWDEREKVRSGDSPIKEDVDTSSLYGSETNDLETEMLEKIVEKLVRIVQHVLPNHSIDMDINSNKHLDSNTASWLNQNYTNKHDSQT
eukprot:gene22862-29611_t